MAFDRRHFLSMLPAPMLTYAAEVEAKLRGPSALVLEDSGQFPNSSLPALIYEKVFSGDGDVASKFERLFEKHGWTDSWRNGLFKVHHYHSTAHEVLGIYSGSVRVRLGGEQGKLVKLEAGDVAVLPAGVAHKNEGQSPDFRVVGAYPTGTSADMQYGKEGERPGTDKNITQVPLPKADPVAGTKGALRRLWGAG